MTKSKANNDKGGKQKSPPPSLKKDLSVLKIFDFTDYRVRNQPTTLEKTEPRKLPSPDDTTPPVKMLLLGVVELPFPPKFVCEPTDSLVEDVVDALFAFNVARYELIVANSDDVSVG
jgi:hypothetical protein